MPLDDDVQPHGNLLYYKIYTRPAAHRLYGFTSATKSGHQKNVRDLLHVLFAHGPCTTWDMAKTKLRRVSSIREQEKAYRRLLVGRIDRGRYSGGILDIGLVAKTKNAKRPYARYGLSLYGILYCVDVLSPSRKDVDKMAAHYAFLLPKIFGRWRALQSVLGVDAYNLKILSKGIYLNNIRLARADNPLYELMSFIHVKYEKNFESISWNNLAEQVSYWFYTYLLYRNPQKLKKILFHDEKLRHWYMDFFKQAKDHYAQRMRTIRGSSDILS